MISTAVKKLSQGELVIIPTETVYGLAADAHNVQAVQKVYALKKRPTNHPLIIHGADRLRLLHCAYEITEIAHILSDAFWPGPLTLILNKAAHIHSVITGGHDSVALRMPSHPLTLELLQAFGQKHSGLVVAPSANQFGHISPTCAEHLSHEFTETPLILDGGPCSIGIESTIIDTRFHVPILVRPGMLAIEEIERLTGLTIHPAPSLHNIAAVPGSHAQHYSPFCPLHIYNYPTLIQHIQQHPKQHWGICSFTRRPQIFKNLPLTWQIMPHCHRRYAQDLYHHLRVCESARCDGILLETPPHDNAWVAIYDRLHRAATIR